MYRIPRPEHVRGPGRPGRPTKREIAMREGIGWVPARVVFYDGEGREIRPPPYIELRLMTPGQIDFECKAHGVVLLASDAIAPGPSPSSMGVKA